MLEWCGAQVKTGNIMTIEMKSTDSVGISTAGSTESLSASYSAISGLVTFIHDICMSAPRRRVIYINPEHFLRKCAKL